MSTTITLQEIESLAGVAASKWERNGHKRHYLNVPGAAYALYWTDDGKVHFELRSGRSTDAANAVAKAVLGCPVIDRRRQAAPYVVVEG